MCTQILNTHLQILLHIYKSDYAHTDWDTQFSTSGKSFPIEPFTSVARAAPRSQNCGLCPARCLVKITYRHAMHLARWWKLRRSASVWLISYKPIPFASFVATLTSHSSFPLSFLPLSSHLLTLVISCLINSCNKPVKLYLPPGLCSAFGSTCKQLLAFCPWFVLGIIMFVHD